MIGGRATTRASGGIFRGPSHEASVASAAVNTTTRTVIIREAAQTTPTGLMSATAAILTAATRATLITSPPSRAFASTLARMRTGEPLAERPAFREHQGRTWYWERLGPLAD